MNYQIGIQLLKKKEFNRALNYFENLLNKGNNNIEILFYLGRIYYELNEFKKSIFFYKKCNDLKQNSPNILFNLARVLQSSGKISQAKKIYLDLIEINSNNVRAYFELLNINIGNINNNFINNLNNLLNNKNTTLFEKSLINYIFSKIKKNENKLIEEISYLNLSHKQCYNSKYNFNLQSDFYYKEIIGKHYNKIKFENEINKKEKLSLFNPIFIIGLPRSGSTLVESMISKSDEKIKTFGEFHVINMSIFDEIGPKIYSNNYNKKDFKFTINLRNIQNSLLERYGKIQNKIFIDKSLENFFNIDIILKIFPNAKFLHTYRNSNDAIIGIHQSMLTDLSWSHDINKIVEYLNNYNKVINYFIKKYPSKILNINLEYLTQNKKKEGKKIFDFCGLNWNDSYLNFYQDKNLFSRTSSYLQIRNEIQKYDTNKYQPYYYLIEESNRN